MLMLLMLALLAAAVLLAPRPAAAYQTYTYCDVDPCKWDLPGAGNGATVTWAYIPQGSGVNYSYAQTAQLSGLNKIDTLRANLGTTAFDAAVQRAFDTWSAATNLTFVNVSQSDPTNVGSYAGNTLVDIRIGAYDFDPNASVGAIGFSPPFLDIGADALAGDIAFNFENSFAINVGPDGTPLAYGPGYLNDIEGLLLHEIGHALGLDHVFPTSGADPLVNAVMCSGGLCNFNVINHVLSDDDLAGIRYIYGNPPAVPVPAAVWLLLSGVIGAGAFARRRTK